MKEKWDVLNKKRISTGEIMERGWLSPGQFHLIVNVWIKNKNDEFLISKRTSNKRWPNLWGCTVGSAISGDDSLKTALKETFEELGIKLNIENGKLIESYINYVNDKKDCGEFIDVWMFEQDVDIDNIIFQKDETCDAMWATRKEIKQSMENGTFIPDKDLPYFDDSII